MALRNFLILRRSRIDRLEGRTAPTRAVLGSRPRARPSTAAQAASRGAWLMLGGAFAAFAVSAGIMHSYAVFLVAFIEEFRWSRGETSIAYSVSQLVAGGSSPLVGALVDRLGPRRLLLLGGGLLVAGLLGSVLISALWQIILLYGIIMTIGANCLGMVVFVPLLSRHFVRRRGMAVSILQSANGFGRAASAPLVQLLISTLGWRETYLAQAAFMAAAVPFLAAVFRRAARYPTTAAPVELAPASAPAAVPLPSPSWTLAEAIRTPHFWLLFAVYLFTGLGSFLVSLHQLAFAVDVGFDKLYAAGVLGMGSFLAIAGTISTGTLSDYIGREWSAILAYGISIIGVVCALLITSPEQHWLLWLHACFFGLTWGARGPAITAKTADLFPGRRLGTILGVITIGSGIGSAAGAWAAGWIFDLSGSYRLAFILSIVAYIGGCIAFWALRRPPAR
jgi:MFS transporter, OFA family, oxalate/formate antiporter